MSAETAVAATALRAALELSGVIASIATIHYPVSESNRAATCEQLRRCIADIDRLTDLIEKPLGE